MIYSSQCLDLLETIYAISILFVSIGYGVFYTPAFRIFMSILLTDKGNKNLEFIQLLLYVLLSVFVGYILSIVLMTAISGIFFPGCKL